MPLSCASKLASPTLQFGTPPLVEALPAPPYEKPTWELGCTVNTVDLPLSNWKLKHGVVIIPFMVCWSAPILFQSQNSAELPMLLVKVMEYEPDDEQEDSAFMLLQAAPGEPVLPT